mmetsp:Transcript_33944/g.54622  ORF Transcript_33944/g.54622 Transcript_33944/m.54622 type:complete len:81 (+) Transcript_33944:865-1107(+)
MPRKAQQLPSRTEIESTYSFVVTSTYDERLARAATGTPHGTNAARVTSKFMTGCPPRPPQKKAGVHSSRHRASIVCVSNT